jgi:hypothetical protein
VIEMPIHSLRQDSEFRRWLLLASNILLLPIRLAMFLIACAAWMALSFGPLLFILAGNALLGGGIAGAVMWFWIGVFIAWPVCSVLRQALEDDFPILWLDDRSD